MKVAAIWIARVLGFSVAALGLLWASLVFHVPTALGRAAAEDAINHLASDRIPGRMKVESIDELDLGHVAMSGFEAYDLDDVRVIAVARGSTRIDPWTLLTEGVLKLRDLQGYDGAILIRPGRHEKVSIKEVFRSPDAGKKKVDLDLGWLWAENIRVAIRMDDRPLTFQVATASVNVTRRGQSPATIRLRNVNATMLEPAPLDVTIEMAAAHGRIDPGRAEVVRLSTGVCLGDEPLQMRVAYRPGPPKVARVTVDHESGLGFLASLGFRIGGLISGPLEVDEAEIPGDPPECEGPSPGGVEGSGD